MLKWFALSVLSGLNPSSIVSDPKEALTFCLENVFDKLTPNAQKQLAALASLPRPASLAVLAYVTDEDALSLESGLAELMRYAIIEQVSQNEHEIEFQVKPFAKAYLVRVLKMKSNSTEAVLKRFRQIDGVYQNERAANTHNKFNPTNYTIRSKSEALAVKKLKTAINAGRQDDYFQAFSIIEELKITHSDYFEIYRVEAYLSEIHVGLLNGFL